MQDDNNKLFSRLLNDMDRRTLLGKGTALMGGLLAGLSLGPNKALGQAQAKPAAPPKPTSPSVGASDTLNITVVGETMAVRPFSMHKEPEFLGVVKLLRESDVVYGHLEMSYGDDEDLSWAAHGTGRPGSSGGASWLMAPSDVAKDLKWAGFDMLSLAYNHAMDWGAEGMRSTIKAIRKAGLVGAGTGMSLDEASAPEYCEKENCRAALVSISSPNAASERAGLPKGDIPARPGVNCIRMIFKAEVDHEAAEQLRAIGKKLGLLEATAAKPNEFAVLPTHSDSDFYYVDSDKFEVSTLGNEEDVRRNLSSINEAKQYADIVIVAHHVELTDGASAAGRSETPTKLHRTFAKQAIDAGADVFVGHGWHTTLGIEIYKNKPIIYGTGNFFAQSPYVTRIPADEYERFGLDKLATINTAAWPLHPTMAPPWWGSAIYQCKFENKKVTEIRLTPVNLGWDYAKSQPTRMIGTGEHPKADGRPFLATGYDAQVILERIQKISANYGTKIEIKDGIGIAKIPV